MMRARTATALVAFVTALAGCGLPEVDAVAPGPDGAEVREQFDAALADAPFPVRLPTLAGFAMTHVDYVSEPDDPTGHRYSLDVRFTAPNGDVVHVFQTNVLPNAMGATDPVALPGAQAVDVSGQSWMGVRVPNGDGTFNFQLAHRFDEVTLSLDAPSSDLAIAAAASVSQAIP
jgi:hypothetical protein